MYSGTHICRLLQKTLNILDDFALCSDKNDSLRSGADDATRATNKLYTRQKLCNCLIKVIMEAAIFVCDDLSFES